MIVHFLLDGVEYNVSVLSLSRSFSIKDAIAASTTQDGNIYRDPIGTYYNYTMVVADKGDMAALDAFWEAISQPVASHVCVFPYNQRLRKGCTLLLELSLSGGCTATAWSGEKSRSTLRRKPRRYLYELRNKLH